MRVDLVELLRTREIMHPSRIVSLSSPCDGSVQMEVTGHPWWLGKPYIGKEEGRVTLHFVGMKEGHLHVDTFYTDRHDEDLEIFNVIPLSEAKWNKGIYRQVFCNAPVPQPMAVYVALDDYLETDRCPRDPFGFFNAETMAGFLKIANEASFLLCTGPEAVCDVVCNALLRQKAKFNVVAGIHTESEAGVLVELGSARFTCAEAYAVFDEGDVVID